MPKRILTLGLVGCLGCTTSPLDRTGTPASAVAVPPAAIHESVGTDGLGDARLAEATRQPPASQPPTSQPPTSQPPASWSPELVSFETTAVSAGNPDQGLSLVDYMINDDRVVDAEPTRMSSALPVELEPGRTPSQGGRSGAGQTGAGQTGAGQTGVGQFELNLPSALAMVGGQHPVVGFARWRVQQAYAQLAQAEALWLPTIQGGFSFDRHDGNYQASNGDIVDVNRNSFQYGLGAGAVGAGTTPRPGLVAQFHLADAIFQPRVATTTAWARGHAASATLNRQLLAAALAYTDLVSAHQEVSILEASKSRTVELAKLTRDFAETGRGLQSDAERMQTEAALVDSRLIGAQEQTAIASARLAQAVSLDGFGPITPMDLTVVPLELVSMQQAVGSMIGTGLAMRPELKESRALVAAACEAYQREKYAPFVPSVLLGFSTGGFGGGLGNNLDDIDGRYDFDAMMTWEVRNLGLGEKAVRRERSARVQQAKYERIRVMDQVAREISESYARVRNRGRQITVTERAIQFAQRSYERNLKRIRDGEGLPLEVLQSVQALEAANLAYLQAVVSHNQAQFELQWAQGWPVEAP